MTTGSNIISTSNQWPNYSATNKTGTTGGSAVMGKDQFLKFLITQLQNQDPMQPMQDKEIIAQMAQFSSVEQLMNISTQMTAMNQSLGMASSLIGKEVSWTDSSLNLKSGTVSSIVVRDGLNYAVVNGERVAMTDITGVRVPEQSEGTEESGDLA